MARVLSRSGSLSSCLIYWVAVVVKPESDRRPPAETPLWTQPLRTAAFSSSVCPGDAGGRAPPPQVRGSADRWPELTRPVNCGRLCPEERRLPLTSSDTPEHKDFKLKTFSYTSLHFSGTSEPSARHKLHPFRVYRPLHRTPMRPCSCSVQAADLCRSPSWCVFALACFPLLIIDIMSSDELASSCFGLIEVVVQQISDSLKLEKLVPPTSCSRLCT